MVPTLRSNALSPKRNATLAEAIVSLLTNAVANWFPNSEAIVDVGMMTFGAATVGVVAAVRSVDSDVTGFYAGFFGGVLELVILAVTTGTTVAWPLSRVAFFAFAGGVVVCLVSMFGPGCGRIDGWLTWTVGSRWNPIASTS